MARGAASGSASSVEVESVLDILGEANGIAGLDANGLVPFDQLPVRSFTHREGSNYTSQLATSTSTGTMVQDRLILMPFWVPEAGNYDRIGVEVTTGAGSSVIRLGVWADDNDYPGELLLDAGTVDATSATTTPITIDLDLEQGLNWIGSVSQGGTPTTRVFFTALSILPFSTASTGIGMAFYEAGVTGAFGSTFSATVLVNTSSPRVWLRKGA